MRGMCTVCARHVRGLCMACAWHVHAVFDWGLGHRAKLELKVAPRDSVAAPSARADATAAAAATAAVDAPGRPPPAARDHLRRVIVGLVDVLGGRVEGR